MKNIAILTGGDSEERVISLQSGKVVEDHLPKDQYRTFQIDIQRGDWRDLATGTPVDKNDFSLHLEGYHVRFDGAFAALHGSPLENGQMQGYLDMMGIPYTCCNGFVSALTMNKHYTKSILRPHSIPMATSVLLPKGAAPDTEALLKMGLPLFVKPNTHGSSFGVTKVKAVENLMPAIDYAWSFGDEVVVEAFMPGREFGNGVFRYKGEIIALPVTEIIPETEFFDFAAKYEGRSKEITPADISSELGQQCQSLSKRIYRLLGCQGMVRMDYILVGDTFHFLEVNTIPGISPASIVPQQAVANGWSLGEFFGMVMEECLRGKN
jgi:D-alanine-D-alanine ligase